MPEPADADLRLPVPGADSPIQSIREIQAERLQQDAFRQPTGRRLVCAVYENTNLSRIEVETRLPQEKVVRVLQEALKAVEAGK